MPEQPGSAAAPEPEEPLLRAGTWTPAPRARVARSDSDADPFRLAPEELPWGIPARAARREGDDLPPAVVLASTRTRQRALIVAAAAVVALLLVVVVVAAGH